MANVFKPKRSVTPGSVPDANVLAENEIAVNTSDRVIYTKSSGVVVPIANYLEPTENGATGATGPTGEPGATGPFGGGFFTITAERNSSWGQGANFAFGNGGNNGNTGAVITENCFLRSLSIASQSNLDSGVVVSAVFNNGDPSEIAFVEAPGGAATVSNTFEDVFVPAGTRFKFQCTSAPNNQTSSVVTALFITQGIIGATGPQGPEGPAGGPIGASGATGPRGQDGDVGASGATGPEGPKGDDGADGTSVNLLGSYPSLADLQANVTNPSAGDLYITTDTGNGYVWDGSSWNNVGAIQGPQGEPGPAGPAYAVEYVKRPLLFDDTINGGTQNVYTAKSVIDTTGGFTQGSFTVAKENITVPSDGLYQITFNCFMDLASSTNATRASVGVRVTLNGVDQPETAAMGYIRDSSGHEETTVALTVYLVLTAGDQVGLAFSRLSASGTVQLQGANSSINIIKIA